ncbi:hypothetical protein [Erythrobacter litoralis]|uniref:Uncharacterized protein n=1 Tax=Erythrobacter litoralis (strain HTCC2594) TaxID=314225 RepID=Q2NA68_ERYLH|nr:hypothetical protein [Erythrobacter litoralis]ABC63423.1 hypothetical protein ELI_06655 [Erythrobacter litoralis HTCC2594]
MSGSTIALAIAGLVGVFGGVFLTVDGNRTAGIAMLAMGLIFQVLCLRQLRAGNRKDIDDAG